MEERRRKPPDRVATCEVEERLSVEEWGAERLFPPSPLISALGQLPALSRASARL